MPISTDHSVERFSRTFSYMGIAQTVNMMNGAYIKQKKPPGNEGVLSLRNCSGFKGQGRLEGKLLRAVGKDSERMRIGDYCTTWLTRVSLATHVPTLSGKSLAIHLSPESDTELLQKHIRGVSGPGGILGFGSQRSKGRFMDV